MIQREWQRLIRSFGYAKKGIIQAVKQEKNLQIHFLVACFVIPLAFILNFSIIKWCILLLTIGMVICLELINTAIETTINLITDEFHPLAGKAKDIAAAAVLFSSVIAVIIGLLLFLPAFISTFM